MLGVKLEPAFQLHLMARGPDVFDATASVDVGIDVFINVMGHGLIHLLVGTVIATSIA
jgi:hypothetical protein